MSKTMRVILHIVLGVSIVSMAFGAGSIINGYVGIGIIEIILGVIWNATANMILIREKVRIVK